MLEYLICDLSSLLTVPVTECLLCLIIRSDVSRGLFVIPTRNGAFSFPMLNIGSNLYCFMGALSFLFRHILLSLLFHGCSQFFTFSPYMNINWVTWLHSGMWEYSG